MSKISALLLCVSFLVLVLLAASRKEVSRPNQNDNYRHVLAKFEDEINFLTRTTHHQANGIKMAQQFVISQMRVLKEKMTSQQNMNSPNLWYWQHRQG